MRFRGVALSRALHEAVIVTCSSRRSSVLGHSYHRTLRWIQCRDLSTPPVWELSDKNGPLHRYEAMVKQGVLQYDAQQEVVAQMLDKLLGQMKKYQTKMEGYQVILKKWTDERNRHKAIILKEESEIEAAKRLQRIAEENRSGVFGWWSRSVRKTRHIRAEPGAGRMVARIKREKRLDSLVGPRPPLPPSPQGLYLYGNVGCGKAAFPSFFVRV